MTQYIRTLVAQWKPLFIVIALCTGMVCTGAFAATSKNDIKTEQFEGRRYESTKGVSFKTGVIVIGGSEGGLIVADSVGPQLAQLGYRVLGVKYHDGFAAGGKKLANVPLESFVAATEWMSAQPAIAGVVLIGESRGSEAALLTAIRSRKVSGVVGFVPSAYVWSALGNNDPQGPSAWTDAAKPLAYVKPLKENIPGADYFTKAVAADGNIEAATIPIEKIQAPLLLLGAEGDAIWPSADMVKTMRIRLEKNKFQFLSVAKTYKDCGHRLFGTGPSSPAQTYKWGNQSFTSVYGGTEAGNLAARTDAWRELTGFLAKIEAGITRK